MLEARKNVYGVSETHSTTRTLYNLSNKMQKHRRLWRSSSENATETEWRKAYAQKGGLVLRTAPNCWAPWDSTTPKKCRSYRVSCSPATGLSTS